MRGGGQKRMPKKKKYKISIYTKSAFRMNLLPILYVGFRLTPFIIICFFVLSSMLSSDVRGVIFLGMLLLNCIVAVAIGGLVGYFNDSFNDDKIPEDKAAMCNALTIGNGERVSRIPLNINIVSFTYAYLVYILAKYDKVNSNIPFIVFFAILLFSMIMWEVMSSCISPIKAVMAIVVGGGLGVGFSEAIDKWSNNIPGLQFFNNITNDEICKRVSNEVFECDVS